MVNTDASMYVQYLITTVHTVRLFSPLVPDLGKRVDHTPPKGQKLNLRGREMINGRRLKTLNLATQITYLILFNNFPVSCIF